MVAGMSTSTKKPGQREAAGDRFLAPCLTWRQYAANHHEASVVSRKISGEAGRSSHLVSQAEELSGRRGCQVAHEGAHGCEGPLELLRRGGVAQPQVPRPAGPERRPREHVAVHDTLLMMSVVMGPVRRAGITP